MSGMTRDHIYKRVSLPSRSLSTPNNSDFYISQRHDYLHAHAQPVGKLRFPVVSITRLWKLRPQKNIFASRSAIASVE